MTAAQHVVRLRVRTHAWTSPGMPLDDAEQLRADLRQKLIDLGSGFGFLPFIGRDGKTFDVRGREVVAVEIAPEYESRPREHVGDGPGTSPATGTAWLQQQAAAHRTHVPLDSGGHR